MYRQLSCCQLSKISQKYYYGYEVIFDAVAEHLCFLSCKK